MSTRIAISSGTSARSGETAHSFAALCRTAAEVQENSVAVPTIAIYDTAAAQWWNAGAVVWQGAKVANNMTQVDVANLVGAYSFALDLTTLPTAEADLFIEVTRADTADTDVAQVLVRHSTLTAVIADDGDVANPVATMQDLMHMLRTLFAHVEVVDDAAKQQVHMRADGVTPAMTFDLVDAGGIPTVREVFRRTRT